jgi:hypothetical protein
MKPGVCQTITDLLLHHLEAGVIPWRRHWTNGLTRSSARQEYHDANLLTLGLAGHTSACGLAGTLKAWIDSLRSDPELIKPDPNASSRANCRSSTAPTRKRCPSVGRSGVSTPVAVPGV